MTYEPGGATPIERWRFMRHSFHGARQVESAGAACAELATLILTTPSHVFGKSAVWRPGVDRGLELTTAAGMSVEAGLEHLCKHIDLPAPEPVGSVAADFPAPRDSGVDLVHVRDVLEGIAFSLQATDADRVAACRQLLRLHCIL